MSRHPEAVKATPLAAAKVRQVAKKQR
jgi:hypothetical protein